MKKIIGLLLCFVLFLSASPVFASSPTQISKEDAARFKQLGFSEDEISRFNDQDLNYIGNMNGTLLSSSESYFRVTKHNDGNVKAEKITKEQALKEVKEYEAKKAKDKVSALPKKGMVSILAYGSDTEQNSWMKMTTTVSDISGTSPTEYLLKNSFEWLTEPVWVLTDAVGISHPEYIAPVQNSEYLKYTYDRHTNDFSAQYINTNDVYYWSADTKNQNGMAFKYDILGTEYYNGSNVICKKSRGFMVYRATRANPNYTTGTVYGHYTHTQVAVSPSLSVDLFPGNMSISGATSSDEMTDTGVTFQF